MTERPRVRLTVSPRAVLWVGLAVGLVGAWLLLRTPTREGLGYHAIGPDDGPTLVLLHGYGAPGDDLVRLGETLATAVPGLRVLCVEGPYETGLGGRAWYRFEDQRAGGVDRVVRFVDALAEDGLPHARVVVAGFSQGAAVAADVAARRPDLAGLAILSGDHSTVTPPRGRVFVAHGRADRVLSFDHAARRAEAYRATADVAFFAFDGGHSASRAAEALSAWLAETLGGGSPRG